MIQNFTPRYVLVLYRWSSRLLHRVFPTENALLLALAFVVGVGSGLGALFFEVLIDFFRHFFGAVRSLLPFAEAQPGLARIAVLLLGGALGGILLNTVARASAGHGVPDVMASVALRGGRIRPRAVGDTTLTASICIGAGGSAGPEGPIVQIGSAIGSTIGQVTRMSSERLRILAACGAAGGISAIFAAPLAGVMFAVEVILGDFGVRSLTAIVVSSVLAAVTHKAFVLWRPRFEVPFHGSIHFDSVPFVIVLGLLAGLVAVAFTRTLYWTEDGVKSLRISRWVRPAVGMLGVGVVALAFPQVLGDGYHVVSDVLNGRIAAEIMAVLVAAKLVATCLTIGSGNVGGLFAPSMVIGAVMGGAFATAAEALFPGQHGSLSLYALVGMAAVIAGTTHAVIASVLLIFEVTHDYALILPVMLASAISVVVATRLKRESIYTLKLVRQGIRLRQGIEVNVMSSIRVRDVMRPPEGAVPHDLGFNALLDRIRETTESTFPVVRDDDRLVGIVSYQDVRAVILGKRIPELNALLVAGDVATPEPDILTPEETLNDALNLFGLRDVGLLPVVESRDTMRLVGKLYRSDVLNAYRRALLQANGEDREPAARR